MKEKKLSLGNIFSVSNLMYQKFMERKINRNSYI